MIGGVRSVGIHVGDQERAKSFWTEQIGFELVQDSPFGEGDDPSRWIEVKPLADDTVLVLFTPDEAKHLVGTFSNVLFWADDINATYQDLTAKGVEFAEPPSQQFWGWWAVFKDPDGNTYGLGQRGD